MVKVVVIGAGNVAYHLIRAICESKEAEVVQQYNRSLGNIDTQGFNYPVTDSLNDLKPADIYVICVPDDAISVVSAKMDIGNALVVHTSGSVDMHQLNASSDRGVLYPLQTFSKKEKVRMKQVPFCIEAETEEDFKLLRQLAKSISNQVYTVNSEQRRKLHLAAVFVNNFVNHLYHIGFEICLDEGVSFDLLKPLIKETARKIEHITPFEAQTGPAKRNDQTTIDKHINDLKYISHKEIYTLLTHSIQDTYGKKL